MRRPPLRGLALLAPLLLALPALRPSPVGLALVAADASIGAQFFRFRGLRPVPPSLVVLAVDGDSLALERLLGPEERRRSPLWRRMGPWPWPRALQAELASAVLERGRPGWCSTSSMPSPAVTAPPMTSPSARAWPLA